MAGEIMALGDFLDEVENVQYTLKQVFGRTLAAVSKTDSKLVCDHICKFCNVLMDLNTPRT